MNKKSLPATQRPNNLFRRLTKAVLLYALLLAGGVLPAAQPEEEDMLAAINTYMSDILAGGGFSGAVLIARDGSILYSGCLGLADRNFSVPCTPDTRFNLGSINKLFTTIAILQLAEKGLLGIDDPIGKYLDGFPTDVASKVTIRHLLQMNSGWGDYWMSDWFLHNSDNLRTVDDYLAYIRDMPLEFEPGEKTVHSNTGFEVAGAVIEKVSGTDYFDYIRTHIYKPAGMQHTDSYHRDAVVPLLAVGYTRMHPLSRQQPGSLWANTYLLSPRGTPAGGGYSTIGDMLLFDTALRGGKLLGRAYMNYMSNGLKGNVGDPYTPGRTARSVGGAPGISAFYGRDNQQGYTVIVLSNADHPAAVDLGNKLMEMLGLM